LFTADFFSYYEIWRFFHHGFGLPGGRSWDTYDPDLMDVIVAMETHYENNFSMELAQIKYLEAIIKHIDASAGVKS
jgi:hypothetical protein